ncbi:hypothetical protein M9H77_21335 [Catharanthus roseus]|uniref:Uncharacterized protein n=1 Tax=Catharanthus roseus TaxID=4058 RepID=A0ACC0APT1_CATRO|nr:hypothetical protein M9H77_21335 [Catharanthus roseus]
MFLGTCGQRPTADSRPCPTVGGRVQFWLQGSFLKKTIHEYPDKNFDGACSLEDDDEADESYDPSDDEDDEADARIIIPTDAFQTKMQTAFEQLQITQEIYETQLAEIVESTRRYADELAHHRASIDRQKMMLTRLCNRFLPDQGRSRGGGVDFYAP